MNNQNCHWIKLGLIKLQKAVVRDKTIDSAICWRNSSHHICNETTGKLGHLRQWIILFLFHFLLLCNSLKCMGHYDSKGVRGIIQVDKY